MLVVETIARIRRENFIKGKTIKEIARDLKVSRNTVRKVLRSGETSFEYERVVQPRPKLGRWAAELDGLLAGNAINTVFCTWLLGERSGTELFLIPCAMLASLLFGAKERCRMLTLAALPLCAYIFLHG